MRALQETERWPECDLDLSRNPRYDVPEWLGRGEHTRSPERGKNVRHPDRPQYESYEEVLNRISQTLNAGPGCNWTDCWLEIQHKMTLQERKPLNPTPAKELEFIKDFNVRAERWRRETSFQSSLVAQYMHEDYQFIMAKGEQVIPLILERLKKVPENWFWALKHLAGKDIAKDTDNPADAVAAWLKWGKENDYID